MNVNCEATVPKVQQLHFDGSKIKYYVRLEEILSKRETVQTNIINTLKLTNMQK